MTEQVEKLTLRRVYPHSREKVFRAWTEKAGLEAWMCPNPQNRVEASVDLRVDGDLQVAMYPGSGDPWVVGGIFREVTPPERLVFTWRWISDPDDPETSLVTVEFLEVPEGTEVVITHDQLLSQESREGHEQGWNATLARLGEYLE